VNEGPIRDLIHRVASTLSPPPPPRRGRMEGERGLRWRDDATMTPEEWDRSRDPELMLAVLRGRPDVGRRFRLIACACCWRLGRLLCEERRRHPIVAAERFADGLANEGEMDQAAYPVPVAVGWVTDRDGARAAVMAADAAARTLAAQPAGPPGL